MNALLCMDTEAAQQVDLIGLRSSRSRDLEACRHCGGILEDFLGLLGEV